MISQSHSAFVPGRAITDNVSLSSEIIHFLNRRTRGKTGFAALKVDKEKAYDRVERAFLEKV